MEMLNRTRRKIAELDRRTGNWLGLLAGSILSGAVGVLLVFLIVWIGGGAR